MLHRRSDQQIPAPPGQRSATLAAWVRSWRAGLASFDELLDEVTGGEEHLVRHPDGTEESLAAALTASPRVSPDAVRVVLPAAGDPRGLPGPGAFSSAALVVGEGVVLGATGLVPEEDTSSPVLPDPADRWAGTRWLAYPLPETPVPVEPLTLAEADHDLTMALTETIGALRQLDVARLPPGLARGLAALRGEDGAGPALPVGYGPRARRLSARATTIAGVLALASADASGAAVNAYETSARDAALRPLATAARRARAAAVNSPLE
ncbi:hypothetical protein [Cryptosporangium aurantiacum]|uniref:Uncharacterized protein n=1 Tax=Cryptosporangium aurantiacum TaxID=134849 RepID=A0A1M7JC31_9ACTN|nr:hypothetical protein [Cryptosporangium aurantiacum]SHM50565.1 hypothetical protein SAMN05443668_101750 [Cryptosporangium aurantiacum]